MSPRILDLGTTLPKENIQSNIEINHYDIVDIVGIRSQSEEECDRREGFTSNNLQSNEKLGNYELDSTVEREVGFKNEYCRQKGVTKQTP